MNLRHAAEQALDEMLRVSAAGIFEGELDEAILALQEALATSDAGYQHILTKPLTDAEISALDNLPSYPSDAEVMKFARRIERAHGIGEQHGS